MGEAYRQDKRIFAYNLEGARRATAKLVRGDGAINYPSEAKGENER